MDSYRISIAYLNKADAENYYTLFANILYLYTHEPHKRHNTPDAECYDMDTHMDCKYPDITVIPFLEIAQKDLCKVRVAACRNTGRTARHP